MSLAPGTFGIGETRHSHQDEGGQEGLDLHLARSCFSCGLVVLVAGERVARGFAKTTFSRQILKFLKNGT
jgi:hypothetical protein